MSDETKRVPEQPLTFYEKITKRFGNNAGIELTKLLDSLPHFTPCKIDFMESGIFAWLRVISPERATSFFFDGEHFVQKKFFAHGDENSLAKDISIILKESKPQKSDMVYLLNVISEMFPRSGVISKEFPISYPINFIKTQEDLEQAINSFHTNVSLPYSFDNMYIFFFTQFLGFGHQAFTALVDLQNFEVKIEKSEQKGQNLHQVGVLFEEALKRNKPSPKDWSKVIYSLPFYYTHSFALEILLEKASVEKAFFEGYKTVSEPKSDDKELCFFAIPKIITPTPIWKIKVDWENYQVITESFNKCLDLNELIDDMKILLGKKFNPKAVEKFFQNFRFEREKYYYSQLLPMDFYSFSWLNLKTNHFLEEKIENKFFLYWEDDFINENPIDLFFRVLKTKNLNNENLENILDFYSVLVCKVLKNQDDFNSTIPNSKQCKHKWVSPSKEGNIIKFLTFHYVHGWGMTTPIKRPKLNIIEIDINHFTHKEVNL